MINIYMIVTTEPTAIASLSEDTPYNIQAQGSIDVNLYFGDSAPDLTDLTLEHYIVYGKTDRVFSLDSGESAYVWTDYGSTTIYVLGSV